jgi:hypothetical protein
MSVLTDQVYTMKAYGIKSVAFAAPEKKSPVNQLNRRLDVTDSPSGRFGKHKKNLF